MFKNEEDLFDLFVQGDLLEDRVVLFQLDALRGVLAVFGGDVTAHAGHPAVFVLGALQNNLDPIAFLSHDWWSLGLFGQEASGTCFFKHS